MNTYCRAILCERYSEKSAEILWGRFEKIRYRTELSNDDMKRLSDYFKKVNIYNLADRIRSLVAYEGLSIKFCRKELDWSIKDKMVLTASFSSGCLETSHVDGRRRLLDDEHEKPNRSEFHEGLLDFLREICGKSTFLFYISRLLTTVKNQSSWLDKWYNKNIRNKGKK